MVNFQTKLILYWANPLIQLYFKCGKLSNQMNITLEKFPGKLYPKCGKFSNQIYISLGKSLDTILS